MPYKEGDWFAIPLGDGTFVAARVARATKKGKVILGYFFGPPFRSLPDVGSISKLQPQEAILVARLGDLRLVRGEWPVLGQNDWNRESWPMPVLVSRNILSGKTLGRVYSDTDPSELISESVIPSQEADGLWSDGVFGADLIVTRLESILKQKP